MNRAVQETDYDAFSCRASAIVKGYLPCKAHAEKYSLERYAKLHMEYAQGLKSVSRRAYGKVDRAVRSALPIMNYGTYLRTVAIDVAIEKFVARNQEHGSVQVVNLGCGSDLRMVPLLDQFPQLSWVDVDFKESVELKARIMKNSELFQQALGASQPVGNEGSGRKLVYSTGRYQLGECDLNKTDKVMDFLSAYTSQQVPTLVLTECVLCYMNMQESQALIDNVMSFYQSGSWISYDPIGGDKAVDRFGSIMQSNLRESRQLEMPTLMHFNSPEKYAQRFQSHAQSTKIQTTWQYYVKEVSSEEKARLKSLQFLDEIEELEIILSHYVLFEALW